MKGYSLWSYAPYRPILRDVGAVYICRVAPGEHAIHFEWLSIGSKEYAVYYKKRNADRFILAGKTDRTAYDITGLDTKTDYEFYVCAGEKKSVVRLARTGACVGTVVNYLHPEDPAYSFSGQFLCSPSLVRHPDGFLLASMDVFEDRCPQNLSLIFRSDDNGETWHYVSELMPCFWGQMFIHKGELYMLSCSTEYGDLLIGKSTDGGKTFCAPVCLLRGSNGKQGEPGIHKNPQNVLTHNGRIYASLEWGHWSGKCRHTGMVMSCDENDDLLVPENWSFAEPRPFSAGIGETIEGTIVLDRRGRLLDILRVCDFEGKAIVYEIDPVDHEAPLRESGFMRFPAHCSKFMIRYDAVSDRYYSVGTRIYAGNNGYRNLLSLLSSDDLENWKVVTDIYDYRGVDDDRIGFQYVDFSFEGDDIVFLCRTAFNNADSFHNSNYSTFDRIQNFRDL